MGVYWNNNGKNYGDYATSASQQEILFGQHFGQLNDRLTAIENGICDSTYSLNNSILNEGRNLATQISDCCCENRLHSLISALVILLLQFTQKVKQQEH